MEFQFTNEIQASRHDEVIDYLTGPRLWIETHADYPAHDEWLQRAHSELRHGSKRAMVALSGRQIVGVTIYQRHKKDPDLLELKNITIRPDQRGRYVASFLLRNTEIEGKREYNSSYIIVDGKARNVELRTFLLGRHYTVEAELDLYRDGAGHDLVYKKPLEVRA